MNTLVIVAYLEILIAVLVQETTSSAVNMTRSDTMFTDCWDLRNRGGVSDDGPYDIYPVPAHSRVRVRCDMTTDGGGWTVLQRRFDGSLNFTRTFQEYEEGFGDVTGEHWLGLDWMHVLTSHGKVQLRVDLCTFGGQDGYAVYDGFSISGPNDTYRLHTGTYEGGDPFMYPFYLGDRWRPLHNERTFQATGRCADKYRGGWWYHRDFCYNANLNGGRYNGGDMQGIVWVYFGMTDSTHWPSLSSSEMKIRPVHVTGNSTRAYTCLN